MVFQKYIYIKIVFFLKILRQNVIQIYTKMHQIAQFKKKFSVEHPQKQPCKEHGFSMQISKSEKKKIAPPPLCQILAPLPYVY